MGTVKIPDESSYHVLTCVTSEACRQAAEEGVLVWAGRKHQVAQDRINLIDYFTHGWLPRLVWSSTNVACTGESVRRKDGSVTANLMRRVQMQFKVQTIQTMTIHEEVSTMSGKDLGLDLATTKFQPLMTTDRKASTQSKPYKNGSTMRT